MNNTLWLYWHNATDGPDPAYVTLCKWAIMHNWSDVNIVFLNANNIEDYLPGIKKKVDHIEIDVKGRLDRLSRKFRKEKLNEAVKCDVYRANIIRKYGGIYLDVTALPVAPINKYFELIEKYGLILTRRNTHGKTHFPVSFYGAKPHNKIIEQYCELINYTVMSKQQFNYNELGATALTPIAESMIQDLHCLPEKTIMPIPFEDASMKYISNLSVSEIIDRDVLCIKLFNAPFKNEFKNQSIEQLYYGNNLLGKLFRYSLPQEFFLTNQKAM